MEPAGFDDLPDDLKAMDRELRAREAFAEKLKLENLTKLDAPLDIEAGECGTIKGVSMRPLADDDMSIAMMLLADSAFGDENCQGEPIGYTDREENGERRIDIYWPSTQPATALK